MLSPPSSVQTATLIIFGVLLALVGTSATPTSVAQNILSISNLPSQRARAFQRCAHGLGTRHASEPFACPRTQPVRKFKGDGQDIIKAAIGHLQFARRTRALQVGRELTGKPGTAFADQLPIDEVLDELLQELEEHSCVVLVAPPGAGKTTRVPLAMLNARFLEGQTIVMLEPRRLAARASAARMAAALNEPVGGTVGYRVRQDSKVGPNTRIEVVTEGVLTRRIQEDPELNGVGAVILDEFHERSLQADLGLALCRDSQGALRPELRVVVMSATLDAARVAALLGGCPVVESEGRMFPVDLRYPAAAAAPSSPLSIPDIAAEVAKTVSDALREEPGSVLAFLPGAWEIRRAAALLAAQDLPLDVEVFPLYGDLPQAAQDAAIGAAGEGQRKVVLATSIAETSLTIEGVRVVVDSGLSRTQRQDPRTGMGRMATDMASKAEMEQRRGRAGRTEEGVCYRVWREGGGGAQLRDGIEPEVLRADLTGLVLEVAVWGATEVSDVEWLDPPPERAVEEARELLRGLGAVDQGGVATEHGRALVRLPLHPRLGHMVLRGARMGLGKLACDVAAVLEDRRQGRGGEGEGVDLRERVEGLQRWRGAKGAGEGWMREADRGSRAVQRLLKRMPLRGGEEEGGGKRGSAVGDVGAVGELLALAYPERVARRRRAQGRSYKMVNGGGVELPEGDPLAESEWIVVSECAGGRGGGRVLGAAPIDGERVEVLLQSRISHQQAVEWNEERGAVAAVARTQVGAVVLREAPQGEAAVDPEAVVEALLGAVRRSELQLLSFSPRAENLVARTELLRAKGVGSEPWPDLSRGALLATAAEWLGPFLYGVTNRQQLAAVDVHAALAALLSPEQARRLGELCPEEVELPTGGAAAIDYTDSGGPTVRVALQEVLGERSLPGLLGGKLPLAIALLNPARRVIQITTDLESFWDGAYTEVRKEMRGRYPKHYWPEDPANATPSSQSAKKKRLAQGDAID